MSAGVASLHGLGDATVQRVSGTATGRATASACEASKSSMTATELRAQLRMQRGCNSDATTRTVQQGEVASVAIGVACTAGPAVRHYRWRIRTADGGELESCFLPEASAAEVLQAFPDSTVEALPERLGLDTITGD